MIGIFFGAIAMIGIALLFPTTYMIFTIIFFSTIAGYLLYKLGFFVRNYKKFYAERKAEKMFRKIHDKEIYMSTGQKVQWGNKLNKDDERLIRFQYRINKILASIYGVGVPPRAI